ncbi:hypothetical protein [Azospirillum sp. SYSU D00513]|uniref:hypothetical protein n=1 Tax=Azospirillum sp. SYSU D00513 TaxID=2812561 RepID=UPI001A959983|nr:hypothetical protein [Azospirillum sp. SYSU D00513]
MFAVTAEKINASSLAHIGLLDEFIKLTETKLDAQSDPFVRESLNDLLTSLKDERADYLDVLGSAAGRRAA